uniref:SKI family transcriptional corepressor 2 n=1 Tax=Labrus bergylta TaxID=56723 RepID=A0A3Q3G6E5_9LABR
MDKTHLSNPNDIIMTSSTGPYRQEPLTPPRPTHLHSTSSSSTSPSSSSSPLKPNQVGQVILYGVPIVSLVIDNNERLCLAQISNTLLKNYSYNEIHNRRVALGITCVQCTPVQLEILRRAGAMPISSRRCGMITKREAERLCKSFLGENAPPKLPDNFAFDVSHECAWGCRGNFIPARYNSSRAKCIKCSFCNMYFSPNKFIFHSHRTPDAKYTQPDAANFNSWRRHLKLSDKHPPDELIYAWEDVKAMFNGGSRKRALPSSLLLPQLWLSCDIVAKAVTLRGAVIVQQENISSEISSHAGNLNPRPISPPT